ncbi:carbohydrate kinase family protein [Cesiribacter andamanensis]|uniref:Putative sugar kinase ydjH n=1 Tax=Cesiribacter andamanensis AMV16 TaxID=1279009 RepID=M7NIE7_9BACT|nr:carbohydrate kinase [Cesiribacter andamanensis]EMR01570.1 putative sugar kinase ydjH [Cesiribacter andamanensis AMV16]
MRILAFGEILFDIIEGEPFLGGAPLNFAGHLARLGAESYIYSAVGNDPLGAQALAEIRQLGVDTRLVQVQEQYPTGTVPVRFTNGQPAYTILRDVAYDYIDYSAAEPLLQGLQPDLLYFGTLAQRNSHSRSSLRQLLSGQQAPRVFYDINLRQDAYSPEIIRESLQLCSILKLNDEEARLLSELFFQKELALEAFARQLAQAYGLELIIITAGARGCYLLEGPDYYYVSGYPTKVVDTVGAGDAFSAAFVYQYLRHGDALVAADIANRLGAYVASCRGPLPEYSADIRELVKG